MRREQLKQICTRLVEIYLQNHIPRAAAAFSYFLTLSLFPMLICLYVMLGNLFPAMEQVRNLFVGLLPEEATEIILDYLRYVSENVSDSMLVVALVGMLTTSSAAFRTIDNVMGEMRRKQRRSGFLEVPFSVVFSLLFLVAMYISAILIVTGRWFLDFVDRHIMFMNISDSWSWVRFILLFLVLFGMLTGLYRLNTPKTGRYHLLPGALGASGTLVVVSMLFSMFIGRSTRYPLVYGSLASMILMMLWFYLCGMIIFMGNGLNVALENAGPDFK